jgi:hypothetical protein
MENIYELMTRAFVAIPSVINNVNMAPTTGLSATSSTRPLSNARNSAASNNRLCQKKKKEDTDDEFEIDVVGNETHRSCWTRMAIRGQERMRNAPSVRPPTVKPPRT